MAIYFDYVVTIDGNKAEMDKDIHLYKGNKNIDYYFTIKDAAFRFNKKENGDIIEKLSPSHAAVTILKPNGVQVGTGKAIVEDNKIKLTITEDIIDEDAEIGDHTIVFDLIDDEKNSIATLPPVEAQFHVYERKTEINLGQITESNIVNEAVVGYAKTTSEVEALDVVDREGNYIKTIWIAGDTITKEKLNKLEEGVYKNSTTKFDDINIDGNELSMKANGVTKKTVTLPNTGGTVEGHTHENKTTLDKITEDKINSWDNKVDSIPADYVTETELNSKGYITEHQDISGKVDKEVGKGLSTNDFTTAEKEKLKGLNNYTLPTASATVLGGVKVGAGLSISNGVLSATGGAGGSSINDTTASTTTTYSSNKIETIKEDLNSQIEEVKNNTELNTFDDCIYNMSALKNINNREFFSMVILGDSIGAGTAATDNYGFTQRFTNAAYYYQGFVKYTMEYFYYKGATGWTKEENGINLQTISSSNASKEFFGIPNFPWILPSNDYKIAIVYCKKTDGGQFDVKDSDDKLLTTIDCSGENNLGCISDYFTVGAGKAFKICPKQDNKAYVIGAMIDFQPEKKGYKIVNWSVGGRQLCEYTKEEIKTMITYDSFDTVYCELFANDSAMGKFDEYFDKLTYLIDTAKSNKKDVILNITNRNQDFDATEDTRANFKKWENKMYEIAKGKNCCLINFDKLIGGHTAGKANGLIADSIHPTDLGHEAMAKLLNFVIFKDSDTYSVNRENSMYAIYGKRQISEEQYYNATQYFNDIKIRTWDNNGNKNDATPVMPIIRHWMGTQGYTKFAEEGALGSTGRLLYINQNGISTQANWKLALTSPFLETVTTVPTVNDGNKNTIFRYRQEGKDDQIIVCVKVNGTEQFKAIQLVDII